MPLAHDLEPIGDAAGEDAAVEDAAQGRHQVLKAESLHGSHGQKAQEPRRQKLQAAQGQGVEVRGKLVHQQDLQGEHQGADDHEGVPLLQGEGLRDGQKPQPHGPDDEAQPGPDPRPPMEEGGPHDGHQQDIEGGEEGAFAGGGILEPYLLEAGGQGHGDADEGPALDQPYPACPGGGDGGLPPQIDEGHEAHRAHQHPHGGEGVGQHPQLHSGGLGHEGAAPDHGAAQQDQGVLGSFHGAYPITGRRKLQ